MFHYDISVIQLICGSTGYQNCNILSLDAGFDAEGQENEEGRGDFRPQFDKQQSQFDLAQINTMR